MLSIIIPTLNEEKYLPRLLESIKTQDLKDYEIIVADSNSIDKTIEIAKNYNCKITKGGMPGIARNEGAKIAQGELLLFLDADLILPEGFLNKFLQKFEEKRLAIASTDLDFLTDNKIFKFGAHFTNILYKATERFSPGITECILIKKDVHEKINGFDEKIVLLEDFDYIRRAVKIGKFEHFKDLKFYTSVRRLEKDGFVKTTLQYFFANIYMFLFGPIKTNIFDYKFGHYLDNGDSKHEEVKK